MRILTFASLLMLVVGGCAGTPSTRTEGHWIPECKLVGCVEPNPARLAPLGAELSFSVCEDGGRSTYGFKREQRGWVLDSRRAEQDAACAARTGD